MTTGMKKWISRRFAWKIIYRCELLTEPEKIRIAIENGEEYEKERQSGTD